MSTLIIIIVDFIREQLPEEEITKKLIIRSGCGLGITKINNLGSFFPKYISENV